MKLFKQQDDQGKKRKSRTPKLMRRRQHKVNRMAARLDPEAIPTYNRYKGFTR
jgi:hypothetical protein